GIAGLAHTVLSFWRKNRKGEKPFPSSPILVRLALLLPGYAALQLVPLPLSFLRVVSPQRAELLNALTPLGLRPSWPPLSVAQACSSGIVGNATCRAQQPFVRDSHWWRQL